MVMGIIIITSCRDDADRRRAYVENNTQDTLVLYTKGSVLLRVSNALIHWCLCWNMPKVCPYVVMRFAPSLIVAGMNHRILSRLTRIPRDSKRRLFVGICVNLWHKNLRKNIFVWLVEFVVLKPSYKLAQIFTNYLSWLWQWVTQIRNWRGVGAGIDAAPLSWAWCECVVCRRGAPP